MRDEKTISYEKPELAAYGFFGMVNGDGPFGPSPGGDQEEGCDSSFDE